MKILFVGDYSNMHACLADALRRQGHTAVVISDGGGYMQTSADIHISRKPGFRGSVKYLYDILSTLPSLKGYDVVQFNNPHFFTLRPDKLRFIFKKLKQNNGKIGMTLSSNDHYFVKACLDGSTFRFSEFRIGETPTEFSLKTVERERGYMSGAVADYTRFFYDNLDAGLSLLPEYDMAAKPYLSDRLHFINLPVDLSYLDYNKPDLNGKIRLFIGLSKGRELQKGTDRLLQVARKLQADMPDRCELIEARNLPLTEYLRLMKSSHILFDQLYSYSPATNALQAMAMGIVPVSGAQPEYYDYIGETSRPVIEASPLRTDLYDELRALILYPDRLTQMSLQCRDIVEKHNDSNLIAAKALAVWQNS